nr:MAG TPA: hypothetical protein [Bacteriophage sp.]
MVNYYCRKIKWYDLSIITHQRCYECSFSNLRKCSFLELIDDLFV